VNNNPLRYTDPTGHYACGDGEEHDCSGHKQDPIKNPHPPKPPKPPKEKPLIIRIPGRPMALIIMPEGSQSTLPRPDWAKRLGTGLGIAGFAFDVGEMLTIFDVLPGDEDAVALADIGVTYLSSALGGDSYILERPDKSLPYMVTINQDVMVTAGDAGIAGLVKIAGTGVSGPIGYLIGEGTDVVTTGVSVVYDGSRVFGNMNNYVSAGIAITSTEEIYSGDVVILVWPK
jgi:hypothetical protein